MHALLGLLVATTVVLVSGKGAEMLAPRYLDEFSVDMMKARLRIQFFTGVGSGYGCGCSERSDPDMILV